MTFLRGHVALCIMPSTRPLYGLNFNSKLHVNAIGSILLLSAIPFSLSLHLCSAIPYPTLSYPFPSTSLPPPPHILISHLMITLCAGRLTPAARVLVVHSTDIAPVTG